MLKKNGSWVWRSVIQCTESFLRGACYKVHQISRIKIKGTPWIPEAPFFKIPEHITIPESLAYIKECINIARVILSTICDSQDSESEYSS